MLPYCQLSLSIIDSIEVSLLNLSGKITGTEVPDISTSREAGKRCCLKGHMFWF